jgi:chaperonin GroES
LPNRFAKQINENIRHKRKPRISGDFRTGAVFDLCLNQKEEIDTMKIKPLQDRVVAQRMEEEEKTKGGIIIPDAAKEKPLQGKVIAVGDGKVLDSGKKSPLSVKAGDKILFGKYSGTEIKVEGEEYLILKEDDILGIVED